MLHNINSVFLKFCKFEFFTIFSLIFIFPAFFCSFPDDKWSNFYRIHFKLGRGPYGGKIKVKFEYDISDRINGPVMGPFRTLSLSYIITI